MSEKKTSEPAGRSEGLPPEVLNIIGEEEALARNVQSALAAARRRAPRAKQRLQEYLASRSEAVTAKEGDLAAALSAMHVARSQAAATQPEPVPEVADPYFAHMTVHFQNRTREVLIGYHSFIDTAAGVTIVDWRNAPIARVFYLYREGDEFEDFPSGTVAGKILARRLVSFDDEGRLVALVTPHLTLRWRRGRGWEPRDQAAAENGVARLGTGQAGQEQIQISALLDREQHRLIEKGADTSLLVLGGAGCGKTTVALHRAALLMGRQPARFSPSKVVTVVPQEGLARLTQALLKELKVGSVRAYTFDQWVTQQYRRVFRDCSKRLNADPPATVIRFKRHPALRQQLPAFVETLGQEMAQRVDRQLGARGRLVGWWGQARAPSLLRRLNWVQSRLRKTAAHLHTAEAERLFNETRQRLFEVHHDLARFLGDARWLEAAIDEAGGDLPQHGVSLMQQHVRRQLASSTERTHAHVDAARLETLDKRGLDEGTPDELAETLDLEDYPLLFELLWLKTGRLGTPRGGGRRYHHLVVDEAQEMAPLELALLGRCRTAESCVTIAGDEAQQVDESAWFRSWDRTIADVGLEQVEPVQLKQNYRGTRKIAEFAHHVLGPLAPLDPDRATRKGAPVLFSLFENEGHRALELLERVGRLADREPRARIAIVTRHEEGAQALFDVLQERMPLHLVRQGAFTFQAGVDVTDVAQVKGLEFDYVVVPDGSAGEYPDTPVARRALHVAITRAIHQVWVTAVRRPSPLLPLDRVSQLAGLSRSD